MKIKKLMISIFVPLVLLILALGIMDDISYWDEFEDVWLVWVIYLTIVFIFEWKFIGRDFSFKDTTSSNVNNQVLSNKMKLKIKKITKYSIYSILAIFLITLILFPIGYYYNNQLIPSEKLELFDGEIRGNWEKGIMSQYSVRIKNNCEWDIKNIKVRVSILDKTTKKIIDETEIEFADWRSNYLQQGFTKRYVEERSYGIMTGLPENITWSNKLISAKKVTFIDYWF